METYEAGNKTKGYYRINEITGLNKKSRCQERNMENSEADMENSGFKGLYCI